MTEKRLRYMRAFILNSSEFVIDDNATHDRLKKYDIIDRLNKQHETIQHLNNVIERQDMSIDIKERHMHKAQMDYLMFKQKVQETLQEAYNQNARHSKPIALSVCLMIKNIAKELGVELK